MIYEFDVELNLANLEKTYSNVKNIKYSVADNRSRYRDFAKDIELDYQSLDACCESFDTSLLIGAYTFSEQIIKNFYYELIEKDQHTNKYLLKYINEKANPERFSPNVTFCDIESSIRKDLISEFRFLLNKNCSEIKIYNTMIKARHEYAHKGSFSFQYDSFENAIRIIKYIVWELEFVIDFSPEARFELQNNLKEIHTNLNKILKMIETQSPPIGSKFEENVRNCLRGTRTKCEETVEKYGQILDKCDFFKNLHTRLNEFTKIDIRSVGPSIEKCNELLVEMKVCYD